MAIKLPEKKWLTFQELVERWQCTESDIRRLVVEERLIPAIRTAEKLTMPDWKLGPNNRLEPNGRFEDRDGRALEHTALNYWLHLRRPRRTAPFDCEFRLGTVRSDSPAPKTDDDVLGEGMNWSWLPEVVTMESVIRDAAFLIEEVTRFESRHAQQEHIEVSEKPLLTRERNVLLAIIAVLCKEAKFDHTKASKTADMIYSTATSMGISIGQSTIKGHLEKIPNVLGSRMK